MPTEAPNTLRSRAKFNIVDIISQGPLKGLFNGAKSIYLDETPVQNEDGTYNFPNFDVSRDLQELPVTVPSGSTTPIYPGLFPASENEVSVATKVTKNSPEGSGSGDGSVTRTITDSSLDALRITMRVPALTNTNTTTGDITGGAIRFNIYVKPNGGVFAPISAGSQWEALPAYNSETDDGATGIEVTATYPGGTPSAAITGTFQYRKKTGGVWGDWITFGTATIPAKTPSSDKRGYYNDYMGPQTFTRSVTNLTPGIYQAQVVSNKGITGTSARQFIENALEIQGKTVSAYDASYLVNLPDGGAPWDVKVVRISDDNIAANIQDDLYWYSYTEITDNRFSWPNINGIRLSVDAESFGGNVPNRSYDVLGLMVQIPSNYDPYERTYTGVWNGTFKTDWTDNPAWIFYDLLTNKRYGLGDNIDASQIDKYALYQIAQYCDELVGAPNGEQEPRYTCSCVINSQSEAYELLTAIASAFRGMIYHSGGMITPVADMPSDPVLNVGPANVIDGIFTYQGASRKARHTVARVSWNNPDDGYKLNVELYEDTEAIRKYGYRPIDINAFGCTSRGLARRWGKWAIVSDNDAPDTVTYKAGFDHFNLRPGDVINIADPNYSGEQLFGLIVSVTDNVSPATHTIKLDRAVTRVAGDTSELQLTLADGSILALDVAVLANTTSDEITVDSAELTTIPLAGASWLLKKGTVEPRQWRVISISEDEPHIYQVTAMLYDPNKYDSIETGLNFAEADFTAFPSGPLAAPTSLAISEFLKQSGSAILECATFSWVRPADARAELFEMQYQEDGKDWQATTPNLTGVTSVDIINIVPGTYNFRVRTQDSSGIFRSEWATLASQTLQGKNKAPENVTGFTASVEKFGVLLSWNKVSDIDIDYYEIRTGASWAAGTTIGKVKATTFKYEDATTGAYTFWIKALDTQTPANESATAASTSVTVSAQAAPSVVATAVNGGIQLTISGVTSRGFLGYEIQRKEYPSGTETTINSNVLTKIFTDTNIATLTYTKSWQYRVRALDQNGSASAWSSLTSATTPKQIENNDITANQIIAKDFRTACNAGNGTVSGVLFNANGIQAWNGATNTFCINAATGDVGITGTITACAGVIGGFTVNPTEGLYAGTGATRVQMKPGAGFWAGATAQNDAPFSVTQAGVLKATSGDIASWNFDQNTIYREFSTCNIVGMGRWKGTTSYVNGFFVSNCTDSYFTVVTIGRCLYQGSAWCANDGIAFTTNSEEWFAVGKPSVGGIPFARIAGWSFNATQLYSSGCGLILNASGAIQTGDFVTSNKGWKIDSVGNAEFNNICARGAIRTAVFIKDQISVVGGCTMIRPASVLSCDDSYSASSNIYYVDDNTQFAVNDLIRIKSDAGDFWGKVTASATGCITVGYCSGNTSGDITKGQAVVNYGSCLGCGGIMLNGQCPYVDLYTHAGFPWNGTESRVRIGNLNGWGTFATDTYGIAIGATTETNRLTYDTASGKLNIYGDIEVMSSGNILPDPDFRGVKYAASYLGGQASGTIVGEYRMTGVGTYDLSTVHRTGTCAIYIKDNSNAVMLYAANSASEARVDSTNYIPVQCGATYTLSAFLSKEGTNNPRVYVGMVYYDANLTYICADYPVANALSTLTTSPVRYAGSKTMPSNAAFITLLIRNYQPTLGSWLYVSGVQLELGSEATAWKCNQGGTITADMVKTGIMSSLNWGASAGSCFNMNDGTFTLGGLSAPKLAWNGTTLNVVGNITITGGSGISNFTDANIDNIADGSTYKRTTQNEKTGAGRAYSGLDSSNRLITAVIPGTTLSPITAGLFIGSNNMGYHNGTEWRTYMGSNGNFYLGGTGANKGLAWDALNNCLTVCGCITSCAGTIGGWTIGSCVIYRQIPGISATAFMSFGGWCNLTTDYPGIFFSSESVLGCTYVGMGLKIFNGAWLCKVGIVARVAASNLFQIHACGDGSNLCATIAGWNFNATCLYSNNILINNNGSIYSNNYAAGSAGWCINGAGAAEFSNVTVRGTVCSSNGLIGGFCITANALTSTSGYTVGLSTCDVAGCYAIWAGCPTAACSPFTVTNQGVMRAKAGSIGAFCLTAPNWAGLSDMCACYAYDGNNYGYLNLRPGYSNGTCTVIPGIYITQTASGVTRTISLQLLSGSTAANALIGAAVPATNCYGFCTNGVISVNSVSCTSDRNLKTDFQDVNVLDMLRQMPITKWRFKDSKDYKIGPVAQDFNSIFRLSHDWQTNLTVGGLDGIALKAVKEVDENVQRLEKDNAAIRLKLQKLECEMAALREMIN